MQKINDRFCEHTTYSGTTYSGSITKGDNNGRNISRANEILCKEIQFSL